MGNITTSTLLRFIMALKKAVEMLRGTAHKNIRACFFDILAGGVYSAWIKDGDSLSLAFRFSNSVLRTSGLVGTSSGAGSSGQGFSGVGDAGESLMSGIVSSRQSFFRGETCERKISDVWTGYWYTFYTAFPQIHRTRSHRPIELHGHPNTMGDSFILGLGWVGDKFGMSWWWVWNKFGMGFGCNSDDSVNCRYRLNV